MPKLQKSIQSGMQSLYRPIRNFQNLHKTFKKPMWSSFTSTSEELPELAPPQRNAGGTQAKRSRNAGGTPQNRPRGPIYTSETYTNLRKACANLCETYVKPLQNLCKPIEHLHKHIRNLEIQQTQHAKLYQLCKHIKSQKHYVRKWNAAGTQGSFMLYDEIKFKEELTQKFKMLGKVN